MQHMWVLHGDVLNVCAHSRRIHMEGNEMAVLHIKTQQQHNNRAWQWLPEWNRLEAQIICCLPHRLLYLYSKLQSDMCQNSCQFILLHEQWCIFPFLEHKHGTYLFDCTEISIINILAAPLHQLLTSSSAACVNVLIFPLCVHILMHNSPINFFFTNVRCSIRHGGKICHVSALFWFRAFSCSKEAEGGIVIWMFHLQLISQIWVLHRVVVASCCACSSNLHEAEYFSIFYNCQLVYFLKFIDNVSTVLFLSFWHILTL